MAARKFKKEFLSGSAFAFYLAGAVIFAAVGFYPRAGSLAYNLDDFMAGFEERDFFSPGFSDGGKDALEDIFPIPENFIDAKPGEESVIVNHLEATANTGGNEGGGATDGRSEAGVRIKTEINGSVAEDKEDKSAGTGDARAEIKSFIETGDGRAETEIESSVNGEIGKEPHEIESGNMYTADSGPIFTEGNGETGNIDIDAESAIKTDNEDKSATPDTGAPAGEEDRQSGDGGKNIILAVWRAIIGGFKEFFAKLF